MHETERKKIMHTLSEIKVSGLTVRVELDPEPFDPREDTHGAELVMSHRRYDFPNDAEINFDAYDGWDDVARALREERGALLVVRVYMLDHSGLAFRTRDFGDVDPGGWDSGVIGLAYVTPQNWKDTQGTEWTGSTEDMTTARALIDGDVEEYGRYVNGEAYGYVIEDDGEVIESMWGFADPDEAESEGRREAEAIAKDREWPAGKTFGELTGEQKRHAARQAARRLEAELEANADVITRLLGA